MRFVSATDTKHDHDAQYKVFDSQRQQRVTERAAQTFDKLLKQYERDGLKGQHSALFEVIRELDLI